MSGIEATFENPAGVNCPHCHIPLQMTERQGIEIDYCPQCRGVWLDRGELDKLIEHSVRVTAQMQQPQRQAPPQAPPQMQAPPAYQQQPAYQQPSVVYQQPVVHAQPVVHHSGGWLGEIFGIGHHDVHHEPPHHYNPHHDRHHD
jgi:Zn-finger nucleic acid-binding protein